VNRPHPGRLADYSLAQLIADVAESPIEGIDVENLILQLCAFEVTLEGISGQVVRTTLPDWTTILTGPAVLTIEGNDRSATFNISVETATWSRAGQLDWWVKERQEWWGRVRGADSRQRWIRGVDIRPAKRE
jgi:hypothetical protein